VSEDAHGVTRIEFRMVVVDACPVTPIFVRPEKIAELPIGVSEVPEIDNSH
jgi:hypothetical protein